MRFPVISLVLGAVLSGGTRAGEDWPQLKYDAMHSGNAPGVRLDAPLGLIGAVRLTDAVFTAPAVAGGRVFVSFSE